MSSPLSHPLIDTAEDAAAPVRHDDSALIPAGAFGGAREAQWRRLARRASEPNVFAEPWTVLPALRVLGETERATIAWVTDDHGVPLGVLPLARGGRYGRLAVRHTTNWTHANAFAGTPIVRAGREQEFWRRLIALLDDSHWPGFLHLTGLDEGGPVLAGLDAAATALARPLAHVHRTRRALLQSDLTPDAYWSATVRKKKRKEVARLANRLAEEGAVAFHRLDPHARAGDWIADFLALERAGWKGRAGSAMACAPATEAVFRQLVGAAHARRRLHAVSLTLDGRPIAMLATLLAPPGAFAYKIAYDEALARFSPGVLLERHSLSLLLEPGIDWVDSCAAEGHPMIDSLWRERRSIVRVTLPLAGRRRRAVHDLTRWAEQGWGVLRLRGGAAR